jgi:hypothetical protein
MKKGERECVKAMSFFVYIYTAFGSGIDSRVKKRARAERRGEKR